MSSSSFYHVDAFVSWFYHLTVVLVITNSCINPFFYAAKYREFQNGVRRLVACLTRKPQQIEALHGSSTIQEMRNVPVQP